MGVNKPFLFEVVETVIKENEGHYAYLRERADYITKIVKVEEENFAKTIDTGMTIFATKMSEHKAEGKTVFSGADAFLLADTYGFPIDLTVEMVEDEGMTVDMDEFTRQREEQRVRAREARKALGDLGWAGVDLGKEIPETEFKGYDYFKCEAKVLAIVVGDETVEAVGEGSDAMLVLDATTMYAEMGGQVADHGVISCADGEFIVTDVQKNKGGKYLHHGKVVRGGLTLGDTVMVSVDVDRRKAIMRAHSATHLLQKALQEVLGDHVHQAGSYVEPDRLRFDFTHYSAMTPEEMAKVDVIVQEAVLEGYPIDIREMSIDEAKQIGATALFSEKYGDSVRVVNMGGYSIELCGGTHLDNTAKVGSFRIENESSVASGVRRIEAITGKAFLESMERNRQRLYAAANVLKVRPADLQDKIHNTVEELKALKRTIEQYKAKEASGAVDAMLASAKQIGKVKVLTKFVEGSDPGKLRQLGDVLRDKDSSVVAVLATQVGEKLTILSVCGKDAVKAGVKAGDIVKQVCTCCGGSGGGKPDSAMGGGKDASKLDEALGGVCCFVESKLK